MAASTDKLLKNWLTPIESPDQVTEKEQLALIAKSRDQVRNDDFAKRFINLLVSNVIGPKGITLQAQIKDPTGTTDKQANEAIEQSWKQWGKKGTCDITTKWSWLDIQRLAMRSIATDGEAIIQVFQTKQNPFSLNLIDPQRLDPTKNEDLKNGHFVRHGIEFNNLGQPTAYHFIEPNRTNGYLSTIGTTHQRVLAKNIIHIYLPEFIDQKRGTPWLSTSLPRMYQIKKYQLAALKNAEIGANKLGFIKTEHGDMMDGDDIEIDTKAGSINMLHPGMSFESFDPQYPNGEFDLFVKSMLKSVSSGLGVSYASLSNDLSDVNFSSIRQGAIEERDMYKILQNWLIESLCEPIYEKWIEAMVLNGAIKINNHPLRLDLEKYKQVTWQARRWQWIDPYKDVNASVLAINNGLKSRSEVIRSQGRDPEELFDELEKETELLASKNIHIIGAVKELNDDEESDKKTGSVQSNPENPRHK